MFILLTKWKKKQMVQEMTLFVLNSYQLTFAGLQCNALWESLWLILWNTFDENETIATVTLIDTDLNAIDDWNQFVSLNLIKLFYLNESITKPKY